jgi:hypothetical protein
MTLLNSLKSLLLLIAMVSFVSCGSQAPMIQDIKVSTSQVHGDIIASLSADLSVGNLQLPNASVPIMLPKDGRQIGTLHLQAAAGINKIIVDINISETANLELEQVRLPNGNMLPIIGENQVIKVPVGNGIEVFISLSSNSAALGFAIPIKQFDSIGEKVGTTSLMPLFNKNGILGAAGVYTSKTAGKNGFALVADVSSLLGKMVKSNILEDHSLRQMQMEQVDLDFTEHKPSKRMEKKIRKALYKLHKRKSKLQLK